jgi:hydroxymethylpyrimidine pyrophosphatase-like HAD family hydrolase
MRCRVLATDYDGTLAHRGLMAEATRVALARLRATDRRIVLVTGRLLDDLRRVCPDLSPFDAIVAENGGVLYTPATGARRVLGPPPPSALLQRLHSRGVPDVSAGDVVVGLHRPHAALTAEIIDELGLDRVLIYNVDAVMILPPGVTKATGLALALAGLGATPDETVAVGDAENDYAMLAACARRVAVANAIPALKDQADFVTAGDNGAGVVELVERILRGELDGPRPSGL